MEDLEEGMDEQVEVKTKGQLFAEHLKRKFAVLDDDKEEEEIEECNSAQKKVEVKLSNPEDDCNSTITEERKIKDNAAKDYSSKDKKVKTNTCGNDNDDEEKTMVTSSKETPVGLVSKEIMENDDTNVTIQAKMNQQTSNDAPEEDGAISSFVDGDKDDNIKSKTCELDSVHAMKETTKWDSTRDKVTTDVESKIQHDNIEAVHNNKNDTEDESDGEARWDGKVEYIKKDSTLESIIVTDKFDELFDNKSTSRLVDITDTEDIFKVDENLRKITSVTKVKEKLPSIVVSDSCYSPAEIKADTEKLARLEQLSKEVFGPESGDKTELNSNKFDMEEARKLCQSVDTLYRECFSQDDSDSSEKVKPTTKSTYTTTSSGTSTIERNEIKITSMRSPMKKSYRHFRTERKISPSSDEEEENVSALSKKDELIKMKEDLAKLKSDLKKDTDDEPNDSILSKFVNDPKSKDLDISQRIVNYWNTRINAADLEIKAEAQLAASKPEAYKRYKKLKLKANPIKTEVSSKSPPKPPPVKAATVTGTNDSSSSEDEPTRTPPSIYDLRKKRAPYVRYNPEPTTPIHMTPFYQKIWPKKPSVFLASLEVSVKNLDSQQKKAETPTEFFDNNFWKEPIQELPPLNDEMFSIAPPEKTMEEIIDEKVKIYLKETLDPDKEEASYFDEVEADTDIEPSEDMMAQLHKFLEQEKDPYYEEHVTSVSVEERLKRLQLNYGTGPTTEKMNRKNRENVVSNRLESSYTVATHTPAPETLEKLGETLSKYDFDDEKTEKLFGYNIPEKFFFEEDQKRNLAKQTQSRLNKTPMLCLDEDEPRTGTRTGTGAVMTTATGMSTGPVTYASSGTSCTDLPRAAKPQTGLSKTGLPRSEGSMAVPPRLFQNCKEIMHLLGEEEKTPSLLELMGEEEEVPMNFEFTLEGAMQLESIRDRGKMEGEDTFEDIFLGKPVKSDVVKDTTLEKNDALNFDEEEDLELKKTLEEVAAIARESKNAETREAQRLRDLETEEQRNSEIEKQRDSDIHKPKEGEATTLFSRVRENGVHMDRSILMMDNHEKKENEKADDKKDKVGKVLIEELD